MKPDTFLPHWLTPPTFPDEQKTRKAQLLHAMMLALLLYSTVFIALRVLIGTDLFLSFYFLMGALMLLGVVTLFTLRYGYIYASSLFWVLSAWSIFVYQSFIGNGVRDSAFVALVIVIMMSSLLLGWRFTMGLSAVSILLGWVMVWLELNGLIIYTPRTAVTMGLSYTLIFVMLTTLVFLLVSNLTRTLHQAQESNRDLQSLSADLENQIAERTQNAEQALIEAERARREMETRMWQIAGQAQLAEQMRGEQDLPTLARNLIRQVCLYLEAPVGTLYLWDELEQALQLTGSYAYLRRAHMVNKFGLGEGLVGQVALEKQAIVLTDVPSDYMPVMSGLGTAVPQNIIVYPILYEDDVVGVVELGVWQPLDRVQQEFLLTALESMAITFVTAQARSQINELLLKTQHQAEELQAQEEELRSANEELSAQTDSLRRSEERLREQQRELEMANAELEENTAVLSEQRFQLDLQNQELREAQYELERKAEELTSASQYKSEFLANMSHELRTPLNSLLILARMLANNEEGHLSATEVESAEIIYNSGHDLLQLINEILDLSKIEAGHMDFYIMPLPLVDVLHTMRRQFNHVAEDKGLAFNTVLAESLAEQSLETDQQRLEQIIKNLLSNAFKFTQAGSVTLRIEPPDASQLPSFLRPQETIAIAVQDTGIGMTADQEKIVFEGFQQGDGSTSRKYGGTGLGLTISRELVTRLGGQIHLASELGKGSTFTVFLPLRHAPQAGKSGTTDKMAVVDKTTAVRLPSDLPERSAPTEKETTSRAVFQDDRQELDPTHKRLLIVEDDRRFARIVYDYARKRGFQCLVAYDGAEGLEMAQTYKPDAIILDLRLPLMSGWLVLEHLKSDPVTRHIPIHIVSVDDQDMQAYKMGAIGFLSKPVSAEALDGIFQKIGNFITRPIKTLLIIEDDAKSQQSIQRLLGGEDVQIITAVTGQEAINHLAEKDRPCDCIILDLNLPDMSGFDLLSHIKADERLAACPVIIYTGRNLTEQENSDLQKYADSVIIKGVKSPERLLDETALFLHRVVADLPPEKQRTIQELHGRETVLTNKHILVVDDDMRNAFALSKLLGDRGLTISLASGGYKALNLLENDPSIDLVLMDIMMPEMDGYETMRCIREELLLSDLPILALTAKAMKGDAEKCLAAGANDYLSKPVDPERLFSMLRVWLYR